VAARLPVGQAAGPAAAGAGPTARVVRRHQEDRARRATALVLPEVMGRYL
jgi:hypothetical protein